MAMGNFSIAPFTLFHGDDKHFNWTGKMAMVEYSCTISPYHGCPEITFLPVSLCNAILDAQQLSQLTIRVPFVHVR
jgi:hypothetical protein